MHCTVRAERTQDAKQNIEPQREGAKYPSYFSLKTHSEVHSPHVHVLVCHPSLGVVCEGIFLYKVLVTYYSII